MKQDRDDARDSADPNAWLITFADLLTGLLTFFVLLVSMGSMDNKALRDTFGFFQGALGLLDHSKLASTPPQPAHSTEPLINLTDPSDLMTEDARPKRSLHDLERRLASKPRPVITTGPSVPPDTGHFSGPILERLDSAMDAGLMRMEKIEGGLEIHLGESLLFAPGSARPTPEARTILVELRDIARDYGVALSVIGHAQGPASKPAGPPGSLRAAYRLAGRRAAATVAVINGLGGLPGRRLAATWRLTEPEDEGTGLDFAGATFRLETTVDPSAPVGSEAVGDDAKKGAGEDG